MRYLTEFHDEAAVTALSRLIHQTTTRPWRLMEVCGGQTHAIVKFGLDNLLPKQLDLVHGPGCPVCVTPTAWIDKAIALAGLPGTIFCSFGDMLRVPGSSEDLFSAKSRGADVRIVYSPLDAIAIAQKHPDKHVIFFAVGFETTAPTTAMAVYQAHALKLQNLSFLVCHVLVPPAMEALLSSPSNRVQGFLAAGHVCTVMGFEEYEPIAAHYHVPIVVTGFEPVDILEGVYLCVKQLEEGTACVENQYRRAVEREGNRRAKTLVEEVFQVVPRQWRGMGEIPRSGLGFRARFQDFDAEVRFGKVELAEEASTPCISGSILQGNQKPTDCPAFGTQCRPERPLGATMVSSEGACAAYFRYRYREGARRG